jgi:hypothetical protein
VPAVAFIRQQKFGSGGREEGPFGSGGTGEPAGVDRQGKVGGREPGRGGVEGPGGEPTGGGSTGGTVETSPEAAAGEELGPEPYVPDLEPTLRKTSSIFREGIQWTSPDQGDSCR